VICGCKVEAGEEDMGHMARLGRSGRQSRPASAMISNGRLLQQRANPFFKFEGTAAATASLWQREYQGSCLMTSSSSSLSYRRSSVMPVTVSLSAGLELDWHRTSWAGSGQTIPGKQMMIAKT
jgi:hypothetical protein